ncbi:MAG: alginate lyase family protein [Phycisphaeraceae bacterium]
MSLYLSPAYLAVVRDRARAGEQPWSAACEQLIAAAEEAMGQEPLSVRDNGGSPHLRIDGVYISGRDGVMDPEANKKSTNMAMQAGEAAANLALAWRFTGEARYADKALNLIHTWCINQNTRMFPAGRVEDARTPCGNYGGDVVMFLSFWKLFLAIYLLDGYPGWNLRSHAAVRRWVKRMTDPQRELMFHGGGEMYNNWEDERLVYLAHGSLALGDLDLLGDTFDRWKLTLPMKMTDEGELPRETMRTRSMTYSLMALHATTLLAEIARQFNVDLYDYQVNGKSLKLAIDYVAGYLLDMDKWPHQMIKSLAEEAAGANRAKFNQRFSLFEMAHRQWGDQRYLDIIDAYGGRPITRDHATLLCAGRDAAPAGLG